MGLVTAGPRRAPAAGCQQRRMQAAPKNTHDAARRYLVIRAIRRAERA